MDTAARESVERAEAILSEILTAYAWSVEGNPAMETKLGEARSLLRDALDIAGAETPTLHYGEMNR